MERQYSGRKIVGCIMCIGLLALMYVSIPFWVLERPEIETLNPSAVMRASSFNENTSISIEGTKLDNVVAVYLNGKWEPSCTILSQSSNNLEIVLPYEYYNNAGEVEIQVQVKVNSDMFAKSNKKTFTVLSEEEIPVPEITGMSPEKMKFDGELIQTMEIYGNNLSEDSVAIINDLPAESKCVRDHLEVQIPYSQWCQSDYIRVRVQQYYEGYSVPVKSAQKYMDAESRYMEGQDEEEKRKSNEEMMLWYLSSLKDENYMIVMSVKDESCCAMSETIVEKMQELGLQCNLMTAGVHQSYIAILDGEELVYEEIGDQALEYEGDRNGVFIHVESANFNVGNKSEIRIDDKNYSPNQRGLNIVVYDKGEEKVIDSVCFDTYSGLDLLK